MSESCAQEHDRNQLARAINDLTHEIHRVYASILDHNQTNRILKRIEELELKIMATQSELVAQLKDVSAHQKKTISEIKDLQAGVDVLNQKITDLQAIIDAGGGGITQELTDAVKEVSDQAQAVDDLIPDLPPTPPVV